MLNTHDYIKCYSDSFWYWDQEERYAVVKDGHTFAHWDEICGYLSGLSPMGLPILDVFMAVMAASVAEEFQHVGLTVQKHLMPSGKNDVLSDSLTILDTISRVDEKYRKGENKFLLVATVLEKSSVKLIDLVSSKIIADLTDEAQDFFGNYGPEAANHRKKIVSYLRSLSACFPTPESIVEAMMGFDMKSINLENIISLSNEQLNESSESFLESLENDMMTQKMAALIPYVISGMNFPIRARESSERPEGGVSDLSNKGHFDQLIVSEFAYDDDYFLSRIVNSEALYFQREKAKNTNNEEICLLIDSSLYMWGLPKVIATAIGCSIGIKEEKANFDCFVVGSELHPCDFRSLGGVLKSIRYADASISPAEGITIFAESERAYSNTLLVTTEESWKRKEMTHIREASNLLFDFVIFTDEDAEINVLKAKGKQVVNFKLDIETIWGLNKHNKPQRRNTENEQPNYPILFPVFHSRVKYYFGYNQDIYFIDKTRGLFKVHAIDSRNYDIWARGAEFIMTIGPDLNVLGDIGLNGRGELELLMFNVRERIIMIYNLAQKTERSHHFPQWKKRYGLYFIHQNNHFYFCSYRDGHWCIDEDFNPSTEELPQNNELLKTAFSRRKELLQKHPFSKPYLHKINSVFLSDLDEIVIQNKRIEVADSEKFIFHQEPLGSAKYKSLRVLSRRRRSFTFESGEMIASNSSGVIEFHFNEKSRPVGYELILKKVGGDKLITISTIKKINGKGLADCKSMVDDGGGSVLISRDKEKLNKQATELRNLGNVVEVVELNLGLEFYMTANVGDNVSLASKNFFAGNAVYINKDMNYSQRIIEPSEFYDLYVKAFIENIKDGI